VSECHLVYVCVVYDAGVAGRTVGAMHGPGRFIFGDNVTDEVCPTGTGSP
jgi:hypothetical protein